MMTLVAVGTQDCCNHPITTYIEDIEYLSKQLSYSSRYCLSQYDFDKYKNMINTESFKMILLNKELQKIIDDREWLKIVYILLRKAGSKLDNILNIYCREFIKRFFDDENCKKMKEKMSILTIGWEEWRGRYKYTDYKSDYNFEYRRRVLQVCASRLIKRHVDYAYLELIDKHERILSSMQEIDNDVCRKFIKFCERNIKRGKKKRRKRKRKRKNNK